MPTFRHGKTTAVAFEGYDLTAYLNEATSAVEVETGDTTTFANEARTFIVGLDGGTFSLSGLWSGDETTTEIDQILDGQLTVEDGGHTLVQQERAAGARVAFAKGELTSYEISSPVGDVVSVSAEVQSDNGIQHGSALHVPGSGAWFQTVNGGSDTDNASVDGGAQSTDGFVAQLHVMDNTLDGNLVVTIEDSTDDSTWGTLQAFSTVSGGTNDVEQVRGTGTVERYVRINIDASAATSGTATIAVGFHRE